MPSSDAVRRDGDFIGYVNVGGDSVAYHVAGRGPDLLYLASMNASHVDSRFGYDPSHAWYRDMSNFSRTISLDRRGLGASDPATGEFTWESWAEDVVAVLDEVDSKECTVLAVWDTTAIALLLASKHPHRVRSIIAFNPIHLRPVDAPQLADLDAAYAAWGREGGVTPLSPGASPEQAATLRRLERIVASPSNAWRLWHDVVRPMDGRHLSRTVPVPVVVLDRPDRPGSHAAAEQLAAEVPNGRIVHLPGRTVYLHEESGAILEAIRDVLAEGERASDSTRCVLALLFVDIAGSTALAAALGDYAWRARLDAHDRVLRGIVELHGGRVVNTTGDGSLVVFETPSRALRAARSLVAAPDALPLRIGLHVGEVERRGEDVAGISVHVAARIVALAVEGQILVSRTVRDLVAGAGLSFDHSGRHRFKGIDEEWDIYAVELA